MEAEPGALFIRAGAKKAEPLDSCQADAIEGLLMLMEADDWKESFVLGILSTFRDGMYCTPADVRWELEQAEVQFEFEVEIARNMARNYGPVLKSDEPARDMKLVVGHPIKPASATAGARP